MTSTRKSNKKSYAARTGQDTRGAASIASAMFVKVQSTEDEDGNILRTWKPSELQSFTNDHLRSCLSNRVAVEANEMLGTIPPSGIKYCVTKGYLIRSGSLYRITLKAAIDLNLPLAFKGRFAGRKIPFATAAKS